MDSFLRYQETNKQFIITGVNVHILIQKIVFLNLIEQKIFSLHKIS